MLKSLQIPGLNTAVGLARFDGDEAAYLILIEAFAKHAGRYITNVREFIEDQAATGLDTYRIAVHSLKGSTRSIGAEQIGDMAEKLEIAARQNDLAYITGHSGPFIESVEKLLDELAAFLEARPRDEPVKPVKDAPDPQLLAALKTAAESYDMDALHDAIDALDAYSYTSRADLVQQLQELAGRSDFKAIAVLLH